MDSIKKWMIDTAVKVGGPSAVRNGILLVTGALVLHAELLARFGVVYNQATNVITIDLNAANVYLLSILPMAGAALIAILSHHVTSNGLPKKPEGDLLPPQS